jgi:hypothetical protein
MESKSLSIFLLIRRLSIRQVVFLSCFLRAIFYGINLGNGSLDCREFIF